MDKNLPMLANSLQNFGIKNPITVAFHNQNPIKILNLPILCSHKIISNQYRLK